MYYVYFLGGGVLVLLNLCLSFIFQDDECSRPGDPDDMTFMAKLEQHFLSHERFECGKTNKLRWKTMKPSVKNNYSMSVSKLKNDYKIFICL